MPLHIQLTVTLIIGSITFCFALAVAGSIIQRKAGTLPPVPLFPGSQFPDLYSQFYTAFFIILFGVGSVQSCMAGASDNASGLDAMELIYSGVIQTALYLPLVIIYLLQPGRQMPPVPFVRKFKWLFVALLAVTVPAQLMEMLGITRYIVELTGCPEHQDVVQTLSKGSPEVKAVMAFMAVIVAPITEECCFRGLVYNILKQKSCPWAAAIASSILFSAVHASLAQFVPLLLFALVQCYLYEKSRSLAYPIILHMLFNGLSCLVILSM